MNATKPQIKRLVILYGQFERRSLDSEGADRTDRLTWASKATGRKIESFKDLTVDEAIRLIDGLQRTLGTKAANKSPRRRQTRHDGEKKGTEGRRDQIHDEVTLAGPSEAALIARDLENLGWSEARLTAFLASPKSPLKPGQTINTLGNANRVHWALKRLYSRQTKSTAS